MRVREGEGRGWGGWLSLEVLEALICVHERQPRWRRYLVRACGFVWGGLGVKLTRRRRGL